jgi:2-methylcitrate dehydratase
MMDRTIEQLAGYAAELSYEDLPPEAVHECKRRLIDTLACLVAAFDAEPSVIARAVARRSFGTPSARILGTQESTTVELAAFANGTMLRYLDFNDAYFGKSSGHPSDTFAAVLAAADALHTDGRGVITASVLAYEVFCNFDEVVPRELGWDYTIYGVIASAVAAGKVMGLSREAMGNAIALAAVANLTLDETRRGELAMWKGCAAANAARNGIFAAQLAAEGMTGPELAIEGKWGLWHPLGRFEWAPFGGRGAPFRVTQTHLKYYPAVVHAQTPITAAIELHRAMPPQEIASIAIESYWVANRYADRASPLWRPGTRETADHSLPYCVIAAMLDGDITAESFSARRLRDPVLCGLLERTTIAEVPEFTRLHPEEWRCRIVVTGRGGERKVAEARHFKGHAKRPLSDEEIERKFRALTAGRLKKEQADVILATAWRLQQLADIGELLSLVRFPA